METGELGRPHGTAYKQTAIGICGFGSQMVPIFFGPGNRVPAKPPHRHHQHQLFPTDGAQSYVQANTKNVEAIGQAIS